jgi:hypothetical protein
MELSKMTRNKSEFTYTLAMSAGRDAGNRSMREGGRSQWAVKDWNVACETFARLWREPVAEPSRSGRATLRPIVGREGKTWK